MAYRHVAAFIGLVCVCTACNQSPGSVGIVSGTGTAGDDTAASSPSTSSATGGSAGSAAGSSTDGGAKFDLEPPDAGMNCDGEGELDFSNIWIANSQEGTVSKIDTLNRAEVARYYTGPNGQRDPSRTSVNLDGDVAVVNRQGGVSMIRARLGECTDVDGSGDIATSSGAAQILPWGQDDCVAWNTALPARARPVAWTAGEPFGCNQHTEEKLWVSAPVGDDAIVYLLDGASGAIEDQVTIPDVAPAVFEPTYHGIYGGAVDANDDFWGCIKPWGDLIHVAFDDLSFERIEVPAPSEADFHSYGMTVGADGFVWVGGFGMVQRYDPAAGSWAAVSGIISQAWHRGMMVDADGDLWVAVVDMSGGIVGSTSALLRVDTDALAVGEYITDFPGALGLQEATGVSIDVDGYVWIVGQFSDGVFIYDPLGAMPTDFIGGLVLPYTYSDMTGWALKQVAGPRG